MNCRKEADGPRLLSNHANLALIPDTMSRGLIVKSEAPSVVAGCDIFCFLQKTIECLCI